MMDFLKNEIVRGDMEEMYARGGEWERLRGARIYITGASGMIASYLVMFLIWLNEEQDFGVTILAGIRRPKKAVQRFGLYAERDYFHLITADVTLPPEEELCPDYIIHAASLASPQYYGARPVETMLPNIVGTYHLLEYARRHPVKGMLFFSSGSVYGSVSEVESIDETVIGRMDFLAAGNTYGESKRCGEALCRAYHTEYGVPVKAARIHHTYGPTLDPDGDTRVFSEFVGNILREEDIVLKSDGASKRAFCYAADTVLALFRILLCGADGESYNVGNDEEYVSIRELAGRLVALYPERGLKVVCAGREYAGYQASPESRTIPLNLEKTKALGWTPLTGIEEGFRRTIEVLRRRQCTGE